MRRAAVTISIKGHDVTLDLMPHLVSLTYTDKADEELDDLQIVLEDREGLWQGDWLPQAGDIIEASIQTENWREIGTVEELPCGKFEVDEMELESSAEGGDVVTVKAVPAAVKSSLMLQKNAKEVQNLKQKGIQVIGIFMGSARSGEVAGKIFGQNLIKIRNISDFSCD